MSTATGHLNRLATAKSPYLRQHATNPVDWFPFEKAALEKAKEENKVNTQFNELLTPGYFPVNWIQRMPLVHSSLQYTNTRCHVHLTFRP
jgi:uncharacterized protein